MHPGRGEHIGKVTRIKVIPAANPLAEESNRVLAGRPAMPSSNLFAGF
jgi:hypothetical protein